MKALLTLAVLMILLAGGVVLFAWDSRVTQGGHERLRPDREAYRNHGSHEQYIAYLLRTEDHEDEELWRRIEAVEKKARLAVNPPSP